MTIPQECVAAFDLSNKRQKVSYYRKTYGIHEHAERDEVPACTLQKSFFSGGPWDIRKFTRCNKVKLSVTKIEGRN
jgi:hypothetical protein